MEEYNKINTENTDFQNYNNRNYMIRSSVPYSGLILTLGIVSILSICCTAGYLGVVLSIIALILAPRAKKTYFNDPDLYKESSYSNVKTGKICAIIGLILSAITIYYIRSHSYSIPYEMPDINTLNGIWNQSNY